MGDFHETDNILMNDNPTGRKFAIKAEQGFLTEGNGTWTKVG